MTARTSHNKERTLRLLLAFLGGYAFASAFIAMVSSLLPYAGMSKAEAVSLAVLIGLLVYLAVIIWATATHVLLRAALLMSMGIMMMIGLTLFLAPAGLS